MPASHERLALFGGRPRIDGLKNHVRWPVLGPAEHAAVGGEIKIDVRGRLVTAQIVKTPFYKRAR